MDKKIFIKEVKLLKYEIFSTLYIAADAVTVAKVSEFISKLNSEIQNNNKVCKLKEFGG